VNTLLTCAECRGLDGGGRKRREEEKVGGESRRKEWEIEEKVREAK
jgi:hypothetical protein